MKGTRLPDAVMGEPGLGWQAWAGNPRGYGDVTAPRGAYMKVAAEGQPWCWYVRDPLGDICAIRHEIHKVFEHPDGTITVTPSIVNPNGSFHGFLRRGVWS